MQESQERSQTMSYRIILHVGPWKTGSTTLQEFFYTNSALLLRHGVFYPLGLVSKNAHHEIPNMITDSMSRWPRLLNAKQMTLNKVLKGYFDEMNFRGVSTLLLSSEDFAGLNFDQYAQLIALLSQEKDVNLEMIFFEFDPVKRLNSYQNQFILQGEYVDSNASNQILEGILQHKKDFEVAISDSSLIVHRVNYDNLKGTSEIYQKCLDIIFNLKANLFQGEWLIPTTGINATIPAEKINLLNEFNRLNIGRRKFDRSCPVQFSDLFPEQTDRLNLFRQLLYESIERDSAVAERDSAVAERDSAVAERDALSSSIIWKLFAPYRKLIWFIRRIYGSFSSMRR
jgi:hypothetical protein